MTTVDAGKAQIDATLLAALTAEGVRDSDARELARMDAFGGAVPGQWVAGLKGLARLFLHETVTIDWGTLPAPWATVGPAVANANGQGTDGAFVSAMTGLSDDVQEAFTNAVSQVTFGLTQQAQAPRPSAAGDRLTQKRTSAASQAAVYLQPVDEDLTATIQRALKGKESKELRRKRAGQQLVEWLAIHGRFIRVPLTGELYYLYRDQHRLFRLKSDLWRAWLYKATSSNPAGQDFRYFAADCETAAHDGEAVNICRLAHWDTQHQVLRVSRFDGLVYRLDGMTIELEANGDGPVVFEDAPFWAPYQPSFDASDDAITWWVGLLNSEGSAELHHMALETWLQTLFFTELCPTQVLLVLKGEAGSGKSMVLRILMRLLFGAMAQIAGIPDKADGFTASAAASHLLVLDNLDEPTDWLRDKLARITTGGVDYYRQLYTGNDLGTVIYRCWVAITARTPDTLRRDDLADRLLILPVARIESQARRRESVFLAESVAQRSAFWGALLNRLNRTVASIRREGIPEESSMRMADFEALGRAIARASGDEATWERVVKDWGSQSSQFLLEDSVITEAIEMWLKTPTNRARRVDTRTLFQELELALFGTDRPDASWPRSSRSFGRTLKGLRRSLQTRFDVTWWDSPDRTYYAFDVLRP
jgi:hypothetical protein